MMLTNIFRGLSKARIISSLPLRTMSTVGSSGKIDTLIDRNAAKKIEADQHTVDGLALPTTNNHHMSFGFGAGPTTRDLDHDEHRSNISIDRKISPLEREFSNFESKCQINEMVHENDYILLVESFQKFILAIEDSGEGYEHVQGNLIMMLSSLLRCCGKIMYNVDPKVRESHAASLWGFIKTKSLKPTTLIYNSLIRVMNENNTHFDPQKILDEMETMELIPDRITYQRLIHQYCLRGDMESATKLLETMKELDLPLNEQIFASLIIGYGKQTTSPSFEEIFELMKSNNIEPTGISYTACLSNLANRLPDPKAEEALNSIYQNSKKEDVCFDPESSSDLITLLSKHIDNQTVSKIMDDIIDQHQNSANNKRILFSLLKERLYDDAVKVFWSRKPSEKSRASGQVGNFYIRLMAITGVDEEFALKECNQLIQMDYNTQALQTLFYHSAQSKNLRLTRAAYREIKKQLPNELNNSYHWPLVALSKTQEELIDVLKHDLSPEMPHSELSQTFSDWVWPKFADNFHVLFELNKELKFNNGLLISTFLTYAVRSEKMKEAIEIVKKLVKEGGLHVQQQELLDDTEEEFVSDISPRATRRRRGKSFAGSLLNQIAEQTKDPVLVRQAFEMCLVPNRPVEQGLAMPIIKAHLDSDDFKGACEAFLNLAKQYNITPRKGELLKLCLDKKEPEILESLVDAISAIEGQSSALFDLLISCIEVKKLKQAQKIVTSPNFRVMPIRLYRYCQMCSVNNKLDEIEAIVNVTQGLPNVDDQLLYDFLIEAYGKNNQGQRALALWGKMQENQFQPSKSILIKLARVLENSGIKVPFSKPVLMPSDRVSDSRRRLKSSE